MAEARSTSPQQILGESRGVVGTYASLSRYYSPPSPNDTTRNRNQGQTNDSSEQMCIEQSNDPAVVFQSRVDSFVKKHAEMYERLIFDYDEKEYERVILSDHAERPTLEIVTENYCIPNPPIESYMEIDGAVRKRRFFKVIKPGDIVRGVILSNSISRGFSIHVFSIAKDTPKLRDIADLKIKGIIKPVNVSVDEENREKMFDNLFQDDVIQAVVVEVDMNEEVVGLSFRRDHLRKDKPSISLGLVRDADVSSSSSCSSKGLEVEDYLKSLRSSSGFNNPSCTDNLKEVLGIPDGIRNSFLEHILPIKIADVEYYDGLKFMQKKSWSMRLTKSAIKFFKRHRLDLAKAYLDYGLNIDGYNVEALVARGALHANRDEFEKSIDDFQRAVNLSSNHRNAKKYLVETCIVYGEKLEAKEELAEALKYYKKALAADSNSEQAKEKSASLSAVIEKQAVEKKEIERKKLEEQQRLKKLRKIVRKERRKMRESDMHGPKEKPSKNERKKKRKSRSKKKHSSSSHSGRSRKRKRHYSSDEYDASDSQCSSSSPDKSKGKASKKRKT